ncbi:MAG: hypothetical protein KGN02_00810 [bacterium]|nr:hypothetical protein [bacterium]
MLSALILAAATSSATAFLDDFAGSWRCGNARYHESWRIARHPNPALPAVTIADVSYGDPAHPDGMAFVYFAPSEHGFRYDDFHADGAQSHLHAALPRDHRWEWTGTYEPAGAALDPSVDVIWTREPDGSIARIFAQRIGGKTIVRGSDRCERTSSGESP